MLTWDTLPDLFSYGMVQCGLGVSLQNLKVQKHVSVNLAVGPKGKAVFFHCESLKHARKTHSLIFLLLQQLLWTSF